MTERPLSVLIIEDSELDAQLALHLLRRAGYAPEAARVEDAAGLRAALDRQTWSVALADYDLPGFTIQEALASVRASGQDLPFIIVSGAISAESAVKLMQAGANDYVLKTELARLAPAVERELSQAASRSERRAVEAREREHNRQIERLYAASQRLNHTLDLDEIYQAVFDLLPSLLPADDLLVCSFDSAAQTITDRAHWSRRGQPAVDINQPLRSFEPDSPDALSRAIHARRSVLNGADPPPNCSSLVTPLIVGGQVTGAIRVVSEAPNAFSQDHLKSLEAIALHIAAAQQNALLYQQVQAELNERQLAQAALQASEASLKASQRVAHVGHWAWDTAANRVTWSDEMYRIFGLNPDTFDGDLTKIIAQAIHPDDREKVDASNASVVGEQKSVPLEYRVVWPDQSIHTVWGEAGDKTLNSEGKIVKLTGIVQDITARKHIEAELASANARLERALREANDLAAEAQAANRLKSEILANTSHELRTPLTAILGSLGLVLGGLCDSPAEEREYLQAAQLASRNLLTLVNDLLDLARMEAGRMEPILRPVDLAPVLAEIGALIRASALEKRLQLQMAELPPGQIYVYAEAARLRQILFNLLNNAVKFTRAGGVTLTVEADPAAGSARLQVRDTGIGVPPDQQAKLFQPFVQGDGSSTRAYGGAGLGLSISRQLAELMGGRLTLFSAGQQQGTTLTLTLPLCQPG